LKRAVSGTILTLLLTGVLIFSFSLQPVEAELPGVGEWTSDGRIELCVHSFDSAPSIHYYPYEPEIAGYIFAWVDLSLKNVGIEKVSTNLLYAYLKDTENYLYEGVIVLSPKEWQLIDLPPGETLRGEIYFEVPAEAIIDEFLWIDYQSYIGIVILERARAIIGNVKVSPVIGKSGTIFTIGADVDDPSGVSCVIAHIQKADESDVDMVTLTDPDGDGIYIGEWNSTDTDHGIHYIDIIANDTLGSEDEKENAITFRIDNVSPSVSNVKHKPLSPTPNAKVTTACTVTDEFGVKEVYLYYFIDESGSWNKVLAIDIGNSIYEATIPKQSENTTVQYYFEAFDNAGNRQENPIHSYTTRSPNIPLWAIIVGVFIIFGLPIIGIVGIIYLLRKRRHGKEDQHVLPEPDF